MASNALQVLYSTIDMIIVGNYVGTAGLSAVSQSSQIINFAVMICLGVSNAGQVLVAQALGSGKKREMNNIIGTLFTLVLGLALFLTMAILVIRYWILNIMKIPAESYAMAMDYLVICAAGLIFTAGYNMVSAVLRGMGDSKRPLLFIGIASVINLVLDLLFTGYLGFGVAGAAWATIIGQAGSFLFSSMMKSARAPFLMEPQSPEMPSIAAGLEVAQGIASSSVLPVKDMKLRRAFQRSRVLPASAPSLLTARPFFT